MMLCAGGAIPVHAPWLIALRSIAYWSACRACLFANTPFVAHRPMSNTRVPGSAVTAKFGLLLIAGIESGGMDQMRSTVPDWSALTAGWPDDACDHSMPPRSCAFGFQ